MISQAKGAIYLSGLSIKFRFELMLERPRTITLRLLITSPHRFGDLFACSTVFPMP
jgi:hypothetical protein